MSKRRAAAGGSASGSSGVLLAGAAVVLALGAAVWLLLDDAEPGPVERDPGAVGSGPEASRDEAPMVVPEGVEREVAPIKVEPARRAERASAEAPVASRTVSGTLLRLADRSPITDAQLSPDGSKGVRTDAKDGSFSLRVAEGDHDLQLTLRTRRAVVKLPSPTGDLEDLELVVDTGWIIPGVVRTVGGEPVPGARVEGRGTEATCDAAGRFRLLDVRPSSVSPGVEVRAFAPMHESREVTVSLLAGTRVVPGVLIQLRSAGALEGWVKPPAGVALEKGNGVRLLLSFIGREVRPASQLLQAEVEADGHYRIDGIPAGRFFALVGEAGFRSGTPPKGKFFSVAANSPATEPEDDFGAPGMWLPDIVVSDGEVTRRDIALVPGGAVTGRVTDAVGNPIAGAQVEAVRTGVWRGVRGQSGLKSTVSGLSVVVGETLPGQVDLSAPVRDTTSDVLGVYQLGRLPPGTFVLRAVHEDHPGWRPTERRVEVVSAVRSTGVDLRLGEGPRLAGQVFDKLGQPAEGAKVAVLEKDDPLTAAAKEMGGKVMMGRDGVLVGGDGRFDLTGLPLVPLTLVVTHAGHQTVLLDVTANGPDLRLDLKPAAVLLGRVVDARTSEPVTSFHVLLRGHGLTMSNQLRPEDGRFRMDGLDQEEYRLEVTATGYRKAVLTDARPSFNQVEREILLTPVR